MQNAIEDFIIHLATERGLSDNYQLSTRLSLEAFALWLGKVHGLHSPEAVTREHLTDFIAHRKQVGFADASIKLNTVALKILFRWLRVRNRIPADPADLLRLPQLERPLPETLNEQQVEALLQALPDAGVLALRNRAIFETLYACGVRVSELCGARLEHLDV